MTGIIVTGHGTLASGLKNSIELIAGKQGNIIAVDFMEEDSIENLEEKLTEAVNTFDEDTGILFLTDLVGGSPFKSSAIISNEYEESGVVTGANVPMLLELLFIRKDFNAIDLMDRSVEFGVNGIKTYSN